MNALEMKRISKTYNDRKALDEVSFNIEEGEIIGLLGMNGAGKTTAIKIATGLTDADSGEVFIYGENIKTSSCEVKKMINLSPQETAVAGKLTVKDNLIFIARLYGFDKREAISAAEEQMRIYGLTERAKSRAEKLSGGLARRLSLAMATITKPKLVFLDEPTLGLDIVARRELWKNIKNTKKDCAIVLTTHYLEEAEALCDKIIVLREGKIVGCGRAKELIAQTQTNSFEQAFLKLSGISEDEL